MKERRVEERMLCADLVAVRWFTESERVCQSVADLEDISSSGARLLVHRPVPLGAMVEISHARGRLRGSVRYCDECSDGCFYVGVEFGSTDQWSPRRFRPKHLFVPHGL